MINRLLTLGLILLFNNSFSQQIRISLDELVAMRKMELDDLNKTLLVKGWKIYDLDNDESQNKMRFMEYGLPSDFGDGYSALITYHYLDRLNLKRLTLEILNEKDYQPYINRILELDCKLIKTYKKSDEFSDDLVFIYQGATTTFLITRKDYSKQHKEKSNNYTHILDIVSNADFNKNYTIN